jgi:Uma2 family endonuclease
MFMPTIDSPITTIEHLLALPEDGLRHELLQGEHVVTPSPRRDHQLAQTDFFRQLVNFVWQNPTLEILVPPSDVRLGSETSMQPDMHVVRIDPKRPPRDWSDDGVPELVVEILSTGTASRDRGKKRAMYQAARVKEYWIVDVDSRLVERWLPDDDRPEVLRKEIKWKPDAKGKTLAIDLVKLFQRFPEGS